MMTSEQKTKYRSKAVDSFTTKLKLYVFDKVIQNTEPEISEKDFQKFNISKELKQVYTTKYWQYYNTDKLREIPSTINYPIKTDLTIREIYDELRRIKSKYNDVFKSCEDDYINSFDEVYPEKEFEKLLEGDKCHYCNITMDIVSDLIDKEQMFKKQITRGWTFEIDRKDSNLEYTPDNTVLCCYWCNNAKTDEFTEEEFMKIGEVIKQIWEDRLKK